MAQLAEKKANTLEAILEAAVIVFGRRGYTGASLNEVAAEAGLTKPTIYHYFRNKADLYGEMLSHGHRRMMRAVQEAAAGKQSARAKILDVLRVQFRLANRFAALIRAVHTTLFLPDEVRPRVNPRNFMEEMLGFIHRLVQEGVEKGEFEGDSMDIALALASAGMLCMAQVVHPSVPLLQSGLEERLWNVIYNGARKR